MDKQQRQRGRHGASRDGARARRRAAKHAAGGAASTAWHLAEHRCPAGWGRAGGRARIINTGAEGRPVICSLNDDITFIYDALLTPHLEVLGAAIVQFQDGSHVAAPGRGATGAGRQHRRVGRERRSSGARRTASARPAPHALGGGRHPPCHEQHPPCTGPPCGARNLQACPCQESP